MYDCADDAYFVRETSKRRGAKDFLVWWSVSNGIVTTEGSLLSAMHESNRVDVAHLPDCPGRYFP